MKIVSLRSRMLFGAFYPRAEKAVPEGVRFAVGAALAYCGPVLLFCQVIDQFLPLYIIICNGILGVLLGVSMFNHPPDDFTSRASLIHTPSVSTGPRSRATKKAA